MEDKKENATPAVENDDDWRHWGEHWAIRSDTLYLNHGSFGPPPREVLECQRSWQQKMFSQPMDFFVHQFEPAWLAARERLAEFVNTSPENLVFVENATAAMNVVANTMPLSAEDEVVLTDHEYGAVVRIWKRACDLAGATKPRIAQLPTQFESAEQVVDSIFEEVTNRTRLIVVSHVTSPTAVILPVKEICDRAVQRGIAVCVDGPHAPAQVPLSVDELSCDFYTASLHKWVSAPFGSGFLFVANRWQEQVTVPSLSWGRIPPTELTTWWDEFVWPGTRDASAYLASAAALDLLDEVGIEAFRNRTHYLARQARQRIVELTGLKPQTPDSEQWYGSMVSVPLSPGDAIELQTALREKHGIEIPVVEHNGRRSIRVSCHLYNSSNDIDKLTRALATLI